MLKTFSFLIEPNAALILWLEKRSAVEKAIFGSPTQINVLVGDRSDINLSICQEAVRETFCVYASAKLVGLHIGNESEGNTDWFNHFWTVRRFNAVQMSLSEMASEINSVASEKLSSNTKKVIRTTSMHESQGLANGLGVSS